MAYGALREEPPSRERGRRLGDLVVALLGVTWAEALAGVEFAEAVQRSAAGVSLILLSMPGFAMEAISSASGGTVLWDSKHLEAMVCGLVTLPDLLEASGSAAFFDNIPYQTLARLLAAPNPGPPARMATPDRLPPPWPIVDGEHDDIRAHPVLVGEEGWDKPSGVAALDTRRLVVVTGSGLIEMDAARGTTSWMMALPGCVNEPLALADGSVLAGCNDAVVRVGGSELEVVAGGFDGNVQLLAGPDGEPWALSGFGASWAGGPWP